MALHKVFNFWWGFFLILLLSLSIPLSQQVGAQTSAVCGNGILEEGEECDDGNVQDGDGCSSTCLLEEGPIQDRDGDGIPDAEDPCPLTVGSEACDTGKTAGPTTIIATQGGILQSRDLSYSIHIPANSLINDTSLISEDFSVNGPPSTGRNGNRSVHPS